MTVPRAPKPSTKEIIGKVNDSLETDFEIMQDEQDESLQRYKKQLLGELGEGAVFSGEPPVVEIIKIELLCPERPQGPIVLDF